MNMCPILTSPLINYSDLKKQLIEFAKKLIEKLLPKIESSNDKTQTGHGFVMIILSYIIFDSDLRTTNLNRVGFHFDGGYKQIVLSFKNLKPSSDLVIISKSIIWTWDIWVGFFEYLGRY